MTQSDAKTRTGVTIRLCSSSCAPRRRPVLASVAEDDAALDFALTATADELLQRGSLHRGLIWRLGQEFDAADSQIREGQVAQLVRNMHGLRHKPELARAQTSDERRSLKSVEGEPIQAAVLVIGRSRRISAATAHDLLEELLVVAEQVSEAGIVVRPEMTTVLGEEEGPQLEEEHAARLQDPRDLPQHHDRLRHMLEGRPGEHDVEGVIGCWHVAVVADRERKPAGELVEYTRGHPGSKQRVDIDWPKVVADELCRLALEQHAKVDDAVATPHIGDDLALDGDVIALEEVDDRRRRHVEVFVPPANGVVLVFLGLANHDSCLPGCIRP